MRVIECQSMVSYRSGSYVQSASDLVGRECSHCEWEAVADSYPALIEKYQNHLRADHPKAWLRA
jgi:predicted small metal-binding protein